MIFQPFMLLCASNYPELYGNYKRNTLKYSLEQIKATQKYLNLHCNRFKYENLPEETKGMTGKNKLFEMFLYFAPAVAWFKDNTLGLQVLPVTAQFEYDIGGMPTKWKVFGMNGYTKELNDENSVLMFNDYSYSIPFISNAEDIEAMIECDLTHRQNLRAQRQPFILEMEEDNKKSAELFEKKLLGFEDVIKVRKRYIDKDKKVSQAPYNTSTFESGKQFVGDKLGADYRYFENRIFTRLGYNNENLEKKERLLVDEVNGNNDIVNSFFTLALESRKQSIEKVNSMFGTNISIVPNTLKGVKEENENETTSTLQQGQPAQKLD